MLKYALLLAAALMLIPAGGARAAEPQIKVTAKNFAFEPATITLHLHQKTKLIFSASEGMHGITIPDLGVNDVVNIGTSPSEIEVTPDKLGTFTAHCAVFCGAGHANMVLTIKVVK
ncbi:MAG TPA: cupredoxin domain-containing protein [Candidatus Aquilonibacter sp.]|nr:cupredoxin domain-containing protein [Candidatus Aquilonibacter sp.]